MNVVAPFQADQARYAALRDVLLRRATARRFLPSIVPRAHYDQIVEAARLAPSGANAQPWHFVNVTLPATRRTLAALLDAEEQALQSQRAALDYAAIAQAPGCIVVITDYRLSWAYPGLLDGTELDQRYHARAERIITQSVAAATAAAHIAAAALGYQSWWVSLVGKDQTTAALHGLLGVPTDLTLTDLILFGQAARPSSPRWKRDLAEVSSWDSFDLQNFRSVEQIDAFVAGAQRARVPQAAAARLAMPED